MFDAGPFGMFDMDGDGSLNAGESAMAYGAFSEYEREMEEAERRRHSSSIWDDDDDDDDDDYNSIYRW